jgi:hypothetical protein
MRHFLRWAFKGAAAASAVLCAATCALWARSFFVGDRLIDATGGNVAWFLFSGNGSLNIERFCGWSDRPGVAYRTQRVTGTDTGMSPMFSSLQNPPRKLDLWAVIVEEGSESITLKPDGVGVDWGHGPVDFWNKWTWSLPSEFGAINPATPL